MSVAFRAVVELVGIFGLLSLLSVVIHRLLRAALASATGGSLPARATAPETRRPAGAVPVPARSH